MSEFRLDRILNEDEILQLQGLLIPKLKEEYPNFEIWLDKAQNEIKEGIRIGIGIWKEKLIATSIIKLTASNTAELKSFLLTLISVIEAMEIFFIKKQKCSAEKPELPGLLRIHM